MSSSTRNSQRPSSSRSNRPSSRRASSSLPQVQEVADDDASTDTTTQTVGSTFSVGANNNHGSKGSGSNPGDGSGSSSSNKPTDLSGTTKKQRALLKGTKLLVFMSLMVGALGFAIATYGFARTGEKNAFAEQVRCN